MTPSLQLARRDDLLSHLMETNASKLSSQLKLGFELAQYKHLITPELVKAGQDIVRAELKSLAVEKELVDEKDLDVYLATACSHFVLRKMHPLYPVLLSLIALRHPILTLTRFSVERVWRSIIKGSDQLLKTLNASPTPGMSIEAEGKARVVEVFDRCPIGKRIGSGSSSRTRYALDVLSGNDLHLSSSSVNKRSILDVDIGPPPQEFLPQLPDAPHGCMSQPAIEEIPLPSAEGLPPALYERDNIFVIIEADRPSIGPPPSIPPPTTPRPSSTRVDDARRGLFLPLTPRSGGVSSLSSAAEVALVDPVSPGDADNTLDRIETALGFPVPGKHVVNPDNSLDRIEASLGFPILDAKNSPLVMSSVGNESDASSYVDSALLASLSDFDSPSFAIGIPSPAASSARKSLSEDSFVFVDDDSSFIDPDLLVNWSDFGYGPPQACATSPSAMGTSMPGGWIFTPAKASAQREMALGSLCSASGLSSFGSLAESTPTSKVSLLQSRRDCVRKRRVDQAPMIRKRIRTLVPPTAASGGQVKVRQSSRKQPVRRGKGLKPQVARDFGLGLLRRDPKSLVQKSYTSVGVQV